MLLLGKPVKVVTRKFQGYSIVRQNYVLIDYMKPNLQEFLIPNFTSKWQEKEFKAYVPKFPPNIVVFYIDLSDNYAFKV
jgi:hypothetical protein